MDWSTTVLGIGKLFGPIGVVVSFAAAFLLYVLRIVWGKYQTLLDKQSEAMRVQITALNESTAALDNNTRVKESNTAMVLQLKEASERHTASCDRLADEIRRFGDRLPERARR